MTLRVRRILSSIFILLFLTITPAIMFYAAGYKLGKNGFSVQRTGIFIIDSKPKGAKIFIDGKEQKTWLASLSGKNGFITTPAKIKDLLPGEYDLKLELDGYRGWQKKLTINPGASTFAENIYLFKNNLPVQLKQAEAVNLSPDKNRAVILSSGRLDFFNLSDETEKSISQKGLTGKYVSWSDGRDKVVVDNYLYNLNDLNSGTDLKKIAPNSFSYKWDGDILYYRDKNYVYRLDELNSPEKIADGTTFNDYLVKGGYLYLIVRSGQTDNLKIVDAATGKQIKNINLPATTNYSFINPEQGLLNIYDSDHKILYLVDPSAAYQPIEDVINDVKTAFWANSGSLIYANDFEIWLYNPASKEKTLITRISDVIGNAILHPNKDYIIYSTKQTISAIELDEREKRNITELVKFDSIDSLALNSLGDILYFSGRIGGRQGLYKLLTQ